MEGFRLCSRSTDRPAEAPGSGFTGEEPPQARLSSSPQEAGNAQRRKRSDAILSMKVNDVLGEKAADQVYRQGLATHSSRPGSSSSTVISRYQGGEWMFRYLAQGRGMKH